MITLMTERPEDPLRTHGVFLSASKADFGFSASTHVFDQLFSKTHV